MESQIYSPMMTTSPVTTTVKTNRVCGVILMMLKVTCVLVLMGLMSFYIYGQVVVVPPTNAPSNVSSTTVIPARFQLMIQKYIDKSFDKLVDAKLEKITGQHRHASHDPTTTVNATPTTTPTTTHSTTTPTTTHSTTTPTTTHSTTPTTTTTTVNGTSDYDYEAASRAADNALASGD